MDTNIYFYTLLVAIVITVSQVDVVGSDGTASGGQVPEFKDRRIRPMGRWVVNFTRELEILWPSYSQQTLLESQIALSLSQYADAITADSDYNKTCLAEHKNTYTQLKLQAIADYRACSKSQAPSISSNFTAANQAALQKLADLDKKFVYISQRCNFSSSLWFLNTFIHTLRDLCHILTGSAMNRELKIFRDADLMDLYRKTLLMVVNSGKQLASCITKASAASVSTINANTQAVTNCLNH